MRLLVSFSGGETSAWLLKWIAEGNLPQYTDIIYAFANTGQEHEKSLVFADYVNRKFCNGKLVWLESVVNHSVKKACGHRVVDFNSATRDESLFEEMIKKYGIPNKAYPHCTRALKLDAITSYLRSVGWRKGSYDTAIGIRTDEVDRVSINAKKNRIIYPLVDKCPMRKIDINAFWESQPIRLGITGYQGNCVWCWKKTDRKHFTLIEDDSSVYEIPARFEKQYPLSGHNIDGNPRKFFRGNRSTEDMLKAAKQPFTRFHDENREYGDLDVGGGCGDSCELWADE